MNGTVCRPWTLNYGKWPSGLGRPDLRIGKIVSLRTEIMFYVYIIRSEKNNKYYIGYTSDVERRIEYHNNGMSRYTRNKGRWKLVYKEEYKNKTEALKRENEIKRRKSRKYIEKLIRREVA